MTVSEEKLTTLVTVCKAQKAKKLRVKPCQMQAKNEIYAPGRVVFIPE
jgi:hypothetical protein